MASSLKSFIVVLLALVTYQSAHAQQHSGFSRFKLSTEYRSLRIDGVLELKESELLADSGAIEVLENRKDPPSRRIRIPIIRIRSLDTTVCDAVFWLSGGPGQSNLKSFQYDYFLAHYDHVMVGYRGVDGQLSLDCPEVVETLQEGGDILSSDAISRVGDAFGACEERLLSQGIDLQGYTPIEVVEDIEEARKALGYESINILSESYGTRVAYLYALRYPDRIRRLIMIGGNPPGGMVWNPAQNDSLLMRYSELWKNDPAARSIHPDLVEAFRTVNRDFPKRWLFFPIYEGTVKASVNAFLFHTGTAVQAFDAYVSAANGDPSGLWLFSFLGGRIFPDIVNWGDNASKAVSLDFDSTRDYLHELNRPNALIGAPLGAFLWAPAQAGRWSVVTVDSSFRIPRRVNVPTLFLSGSLDFSTPAENVERLFIPFFPRGHHVILSEAGHVKDLWQSQPAATHKLLTTFFLSGEIDTSLVRYVPVSFEVKRGFGGVAKLLVGSVLVVLLAVGYGCWRIFK